MSTLKILDLYCGAGGCAKGYELACNDLGIIPEITGVDIERQHNYPYNFVEYDAISYLQDHYSLYDFIHASPPCQAWTRALDGTMFNLRVIRKRLFESSIPLPVAPIGKKKGTVGGKNYRSSDPGYYFIVGGHQSGTLQQWRDAMGIPWMKKKELAQAIPPAYTRWIGLQIFPELINLYT